VRDTQACGVDVCIFDRLVPTFFFFVESATERNMYLDMLDCLLSRKLQTLKAKRKLQLFSEGTVRHSVSVARRDVP
jgi:hypothetical protein